MLSAHADADEVETKQLGQGARDRVLAELSFDCGHVDARLRTSFLEWLAGEPLREDVLKVLLARPCPFGCIPGLGFAPESNCNGRTGDSKRGSCHTTCDRVHDGFPSMTAPVADYEDRRDASFVNLPAHCGGLTYSGGAPQRPLPS